MWNSEDFGEYYKKVSNTELINILDNQKDYQPVALKAAKEEFEKRQLSAFEIEEARRPQLEKQFDREKEKEKIKAVENKISIASQNIFNTINPVQTGIPSTEKLVRFLVIAFGITFLYTFIAEFRSYIFYLKDFPKSPFDSSLFLFPMVLLAAGTFTFWKRKRIGWILLTILLTNSTIGLIWSYINLYFFTSQEDDYLSYLNVRLPLRTYIIELVFYLGSLYILCKPNIREIYLVSNRRMKATIGITVVLSSLLILAVMYRY